MMNTLASLAFLLLLGAGYSLWRSQPAYRMLALGILLLGLRGAIAGLLRLDALPMRLAPVLLGDFTWLVTIGLIAAGAYSLRNAGPPRGASGAAPSPPAPARAPGGQPTYLHPSDATMESLIIPRNATNSFTRAEALLDQLYQRIERECQRAGLTAIGYKSHARSGTTWARFDYLLPQDTENLSLRAGLVVTVERFDFHRFEHTLTLEVIHGTQRKTVRGLIELVDGDLQALSQFVSTGGAFPQLVSRRVRMWPLQLWRPPNKVDRLRTDWLTLGVVFGLIVIFFLPPQVLPPLLKLLLLIGGIIAFRSYLKRRKTYILTTGKPLHDPRELIRMDGWQTTVYGLGPRQGEVRAALLERLRATAETGIQVEPERIWYPGVDGKVEREQIVCTFRRAIAFLHLERYGDDLYVGWDSHVNAATWVEQTLARGVDRVTSKVVVANRVVPGWQAPNEYDITDVNFLTEWLHAATTRLVRLKMEELRIDQEIDFTIQRESRKAALQTSRPEAKGAPTGLAGLASRLRRVA